MRRQERESRWLTREAVASDFVPAYLKPGQPPLAERARSALQSLACCRVCPRQCDVNRLAGEAGVCHIARHARVTSAFPHFGEEDCLRGTRGSGTIFLGRCNLRCVFCQNWDISQADAGELCPASAIADLMLELQAQGCHNINLVTPEHVVPQMIEAIAAAVERGLRLPIVYNTSGYDSVESIRQLEGIVDIYMPDFKLWTRESCRRYLGAADYAERARDAIAEMHRQVGDLRFTPDGLACRGLLVRHLVMPGLLQESEAMLRWLAECISRDTFVNIMAQYRPEYRVGGREKANDSLSSIRFAEINRRPTVQEIETVGIFAKRAGLRRADSA